MGMMRKENFCSTKLLKHQTVIIGSCSHSNGYWLRRFRLPRNLGASWDFSAIVKAQTVVETFRVGYLNEVYLKSLFNNETLEPPDLLLSGLFYEDKCFSSLLHLLS